MTDLVKVAAGWWRARVHRLSNELGISQTTEIVLWVIGVVAIAGVAIAAITAYINGKLAQIN
jgi:hypothetical protein